MKRFETCLWFDHQAKDAAEFYHGIFDKVEIKRTAHYTPSSAEVSGQKAGSLMTVQFSLENLDVLGLNGGPEFKPTPALSFFVSCHSPEEIQAKWAKLSAGGTIRMGLDKYPWAEQYGWAADKFGVEWQLMYAEPRPHKVAPSFLFVDKLYGRGDEAIKHYTSIFPDSKILATSRDEKAGVIAHCEFELDGHAFALMEGQGEHGYTFNEATSIIVKCDSQKEIDYYWEKLSAGGSEGPCGWLKDKFGVSWQINPREMDEIMSDPKRADRAFAAMVKMKKIDLKTIREAAR